MRGSATAVLWDVDGTLLTSGSVAAQAFLDAVADVAGRRPVGRGLDLGGRIDPEIATMLLQSVGADADLVPAVLSRLHERMASRAEELRRRVKPLAGVVDLVRLLHAAGVRQTVVTGNIESVARMKLAAVGVVPPIDPNLGGFGDSGADRVAVACRALDHLIEDGWQPSLGQCWIIGDTPRNLLCARAVGVRCALIGSGRHSAESMAGLAPDVLTGNLADSAVLLGAMGLRG